MITACGNHSLAVARDKGGEALYGWGAGVYGETGIGEF